MSMWLLSGVEPIFSEYVTDHNYLTCPLNYKLSDKEHQAIIASIIGDGYLSFPYRRTSGVSARIVWNMGNKQHALHKKDFFSFLGAKMTEVDNAGWGDRCYRVVTKSHPVLTSYHHKYYKPDGSKNLQKIIKELDWFGWAWLYGDDGHVKFQKNKTCADSVCVYIHSEGYGKDGTQAYIDRLSEMLGGNDGLNLHKYTGGTPRKTRYCVRMNNEKSKEFIKRVAPHMARGMEYKVRRIS